jgi:glycosyltransferase involved in cell wall biosynthesis
VSPPFIMSAFLVRHKKKQLLIGYRGTSNSHIFNNAIVRFVRSRVLNLANFIVTSGRDSTNAVLSMGISESKIVTLFNPVDVTWFKDNVLKYRTSGLPGHKFLYVGQLIERKNISSLVRAFSSMRQPEDTLSIVGGGILENDLKALVQELGLQSSVFFLGSKSQEELVSIYAVNNTLILPSKKEVWGLVANEALACGLHVVVSDKCGVAEFIRGMKGVYVTGVESNSIADSMRDSRSHWIGHIPSPEIMEFTPEKFATEIIALLEP